MRPRRRLAGRSARDRHDRIIVTEKLDGSNVMAAQRRRTDVMPQLAVYKATTTPEQRKAETEDYFTRMREVRG